MPFRTPLALLTVFFVSLGQSAHADVAARFDASLFTAAVTGLATWEDSSGFDHDATQGNASLRPNVVMGAQNNLPVVRFDGSDDFLTVAHTYTTGTAFIIANYSSSTFNWFDGLYGATTNNGAPGQYWTGFNNSASWSNESGGGFHNSKYLNGTLSNTGLTTAGAYNLYSGVDATPNSFTSWSVGRDRGIGGRTWEGDIAEIIVYDETLSDFDRKGVEVYLDEKWGLGLDLRNTTGSFNDDIFALGLTAVPEPSSILMLGTCLLGFSLRRRRPRGDGKQVG